MNPQSLKTLLPSLTFVLCLSLQSFAQHNNYKVENLPFIEQGDPTTPDKNRDLDYYSVTDQLSQSVLKVRATYLASCGMERKAGLQFNAVLNNLGDTYGFCFNTTTYTLMQMYSKNVKEQKIADATIANKDSSARFEAFLVTSPKVQVKTVLQLPSMSEPMIKMYDLPFTFIPYEKRSPEALQIVKELFETNEIDRFKIEDISGDRYQVRVKNGTYGMEKIPCLYFEVAFNGSGSADNTVAVTQKALQEATTSGNIITIKNRDLKSNRWGPGTHHYTVTVNKATKKATIAITTNTTALPLERTYALPF